MSVHLTQRERKREREEVNGENTKQKKREKLCLFIVCIVFVTFFSSFSFFQTLFYILTVVILPTLYIKWQHRKDDETNLPIVFFSELPSSERSHYCVRCVLQGTDLTKLRHESK